MNLVDEQQVRPLRDQLVDDGVEQEALGLTLDFCWNHLNLNRVQLVVFKHNARAVGAYKAAGFKKEGVLRKAAFIDGDWVDLVLMAALRPSRKGQKSRQLSDLARMITELRQPPAAA